MRARRGMPPLSARTPQLVHARTPHIACARTPHLARERPEPTPYLACMRVHPTLRACHTPYLERARASSVYTPPCTHARTYTPSGARTHVAHIHPTLRVRARERIHPTLRAHTPHLHAPPSLCAHGRRACSPHLVRAQASRGFNGRKCPKGHRTQNHSCWNNSLIVPCSDGSGCTWTLCAYSVRGVGLGWSEHGRSGETLVPKLGGWCVLGLAMGLPHSP